MLGFLVKKYPETSLFRGSKLVNVCFHTFFGQRFVKRSLSRELQTTFLLFFSYS